MRKLNILIVPGIIFSMFFLFGCSRSQTPGPQTSEGTPAGEHSMTMPMETNTETPMDNMKQADNSATGELSGKVVDGVREVEMKAYQFKFVPDVVNVKKGEKVRLLVESMDVTHGLAIDALNINQNLPPHKVETIEFTPDKTGTFPFDCSVYCGVEHGKMTGKLVVQ